MYIYIENTFSDIFLILCPTLSVSLLHCFHSETSFVLDLEFCNGNTKGTIAFHKKLDW